MYISIGQGEPASQKRRRQNSGFTLPEVLVSLVICVMLMQTLGHWGVLTYRANQQMNENQQAVFLAQMALAGSEAHIPEGWEVIVNQTVIGNEKFLRQWEITVRHENHQWQFYYAGE